MTKKGRPTKNEALARAWATIRAAGGDGAATFDIKAVLIAIASDAKVSPTARVSACKMLRELDLAARNTAALDAALD